MVFYQNLDSSDVNENYNAIGLGLRNPVDLIGQSMIDQAKTELTVYQYAVAFALVISAIMLFFVIYFFCKRRQDQDEIDQIPYGHFKSGKFNVSASSKSKYNINESNN